MYVVFIVNINNIKYVTYGVHKYDAPASNIHCLTIALASEYKVNLTPASRALQQSSLLKTLTSTTCLATLSVNINCGFILLVCAKLPIMPSIA